MPDWDILGFGAVAVDDLLLMDSYPLPDSKMPIREKQTARGAAWQARPWLPPSAPGRTDGLCRRPGRR